MAHACSLSYCGDFESTTHFYLEYWRETKFKFDYTLPWALEMEFSSITPQFLRMET